MAMETDIRSMGFRLFKQMSVYSVWKCLSRFMFVFACVQVCLSISWEHWQAVAATASMLRTTTSDGLLASHVLKQSLS